MAHIKWGQAEECSHKAAEGGYIATSYTQVADSLLRVSIIKVAHPAMGITAEKLTHLMKSAQKVIYRIPEGRAVPLFHDTFLSCGTVQLPTTEWLSQVISKLRLWKGANMQVVHTNLLPTQQRMVVWIPEIPV
jgi:hypothetical protein